MLVTNMATDFWLLRAQAKRAYPGSFANRRRWFRAKLGSPRVPKVPIGNMTPRVPDMFQREMPR